MRMLTYLLKKGIVASSGNVSQKDGWEKQILICWCESQMVASLMEKELNLLSGAVRQDSMVVLLATSDDIAELFYASESSSNVMRLGAITRAQVKGVFAKEVAKRPSYDAEPTMSDQALICRNHAFFGEKFGGLNCQICSFETNARVWKCDKRDCDVALCGGCMDKWKSKVNH